MGFHVLAKHGLNKHGLKDQNLVSFGGEKNRERRERERKEEEEEEEEKKSKQSQAPKRYGTTNLEYGTWIFDMDPWFCLVNGYLLYPNLGFVRISS